MVSWIRVELLSIGSWHFLDQLNCCEYCELCILFEIFLRILTSYKNTDGLT